MSADSLIDTNILVYAYDTTEREKHLKCRNLVEECWRGKERYAVSLQNLSEFYVVLTNKVERPVSVETARERIGRIINFTNWIKINPGINTVLHAIDIAKEYNIHYFDALLAATMKEHEITKIHTENEADFKKIPWLEVVNPLSRLK